MGGHEVVVVGVDESDYSLEALRVALDEAVRRQASVRVVSVFESSGLFAGRYNIPIPVPDEELAKTVTADVGRIVDRELASHHVVPPLEIVARPGSPARVLVEESENAALLIVGHRGRGGFASSLLGSVGMQCVLHARCPVLVVRPTAGDSRS